MVKRRAPCCDSSQVKRGPWSDEESEILTSFILQNGHQNWRSLPKLAGLMRCGKSCRLRWINYLRPGLKRGNFTKQEEDTIIQLHQTHGNKWSMIASQLPGRTDNEIKNVWNTRLKKHLLSKTNSSDVTNQPSPVSNSSSSSSVSNSEKHNNQDEEFDEILMEHMSCGFDVAAPQSLEFLFQDHQIPPPLTISRPESLEITGPSDHELWTQMVEPGSDDYNEWLNYLDNQT